MITDWSIALSASHTDGRYPRRLSAAMNSASRAGCGRYDAPAVLSPSLLSPRLSPFELPFELRCNQIRVGNVSSHLQDILQVMLLHGMREARDGRHRGAREVGAERGGVQRRRHQDDPQRGPVREHVPQQDEQKSESSDRCVNLVDDDVRHPREQRIFRQPSSSTPVVTNRILVDSDATLSRRILYPTARTLGAEFFASLLRHSRRHGRGGDAPRLRANQTAPAALVPCDGVVQYELRQLGRLAAPSLSGDDHNLVGANRREEFLAFGPRGQSLTLRVNARVEIVPFRRTAFPLVGGAGRPDVSPGGIVPPSRKNPFRPSSAPSAAARSQRRL